VFFIIPNFKIKVVISTIMRMAAKKAKTFPKKSDDYQNSRILNSTRLFLARPAAVALSEIGCSEP